MNKLGIMKSNLHSYKDFGLWIVSKKIGNPSKNKITAKVPYQNGEYDFSNLYGDQTYSERTLEYVFEIVENSKVLMNIKKIEALNWLSSGGEKEKLHDDTIEGFYFLAECTELDTEENGSRCKITAIFTAYPFKLGNNLEGADIWDEFYFDLDYFTETTFEISGSKIVQIMNPSVCKVTPTIITDSDFYIMKNNNTYIVKKGVSFDNKLKLDVGVNTLELKGKGIIEFQFRKEVI